MLVNKFVDDQRFRHVIYSQSMLDAYSGAMFPGVTDLMDEIDKQAYLAARWEMVKELEYTHLFTLVGGATALNYRGHYLDNCIQ